MKQLSDNDANQLGIHTIHHEMDNGEKRFRLVSNHGSSYILTQSKSNSYWQKSHVHFHKNEYYIVERGFILLALMIDGKVKIEKFGENDSFSIPSGTAHNVWMSDNTILHNPDKRHTESERTAWRSAQTARNAQPCSVSCLFACFFL